MSEAQNFLFRFSTALEDAKIHARSSFPEESCGFIVDGIYKPMQNMAKPADQHDEADIDCPCALCSFEVDDTAYLAHASKLQAVVHSHPNGPAFPSKSDMLHQTASAVAWIIITLDEQYIGPTIVWGGDCPAEPLLGREFIHGVNDCYALIRDVFALGKEGMAAQDMEWPFKSIELPVGERDDSWWLNETENDLYDANYVEVGFREIAPNEVRPGDCFLGKIRSEKLNHAGVLLGNNLILHHLPSRLSRREPAGVWARCSDKWVRYVGAENA